MPPVTSLVAPTASLGRSNPTSCSRIRYRTSLPVGVTTSWSAPADGSCTSPPDTCVVVVESAATSPRPQLAAPTIASIGAIIAVSHWFIDMSCVLPVVEWSCAGGIAALSVIGSVHCEHRDPGAHHGRHAYRADRAPSTPPRLRRTASAGRQSESYAPPRSGVRAAGSSACGAPSSSRAPSPYHPSHAPHALPSSPR